MEALNSYKIVYSFVGWTPPVRQYLVATPAGYAMGGKVLAIG